jgi:Ca-activated chloride channel family protein
MRKVMDEAKLTAYALGELSERERAEVEGYLEGSAEARAEVERVRETAGLLREALAQEASERLTPEQRARIEGRAAASPRRRRTAAAGVLATAASLTVALLVTWNQSLSRQVPQLEGPGLDSFLSPPTSGEAPLPPSKPAALSSRELEALRALGYVGSDASGPLVEPFDSGRQDVRRFQPDDGTLEPDAGIRHQSGPFTTEAYDAVEDNPFITVAQSPLSTFSIDVDTASYANVRRFLREGELPPPGAVRIEELVNTFTYDYEPPRGEHPFAVHLAAATCPWAPDHELVRIGLKGREIEKAKRPPSNLVFLIDVSGSMDEENKLPLLKRALGLLIGELDERDRVAMVVYAGASGLVLPSTPAGSKEPLLVALDRLQAGGSTHGSEGIRLAYETAATHFIEGGVNRVILATDGDFNVGVTSQDELTRLIEEKAKSGVFLTVLGFGMGNYKDSTLEKLADHGNGNYGYIDSQREARRLLVDQMGGTLVTIAKDVKIQVEFNPAQVAEYRLIGYENRVMADHDFDDDTKDAGEIGAGHTVTAFYEVVPVGAPPVARTARPLKYQQPRRLSKKAHGQETLTVHLRYKKPAGEASVLLEAVLKGAPASFEEAPDDFRFASAVAAFGMILRDSPYRGSASLADVGRWARGALGKDATGQRQELVDLVGVAERLRARGVAPE